MHGLILGVFQLRAPIFLMVFVLGLVSLTAEAQAQRRTLFDLLFGDQNQQQQQQQQQAPQRPTQSAPRPTAAPSASVTVIAEPAIDKNENATRLLVMGDSLASDLSKGFERAFADDPNLLVLGKGVGSSGLVRDDFYDWNAALAAEIEADSFDMAVVIIGINDRQAIGRNQPLSDEWKVEYTNRAAQIVSQLRVAGKPTLWIELPPMRAASYSSAISQISSIHRSVAVGAGVEFVDIYERFLDEAGNYSNSGPDLNGQTVSVRKSDGIHFSSAGSDKVAFYVIQAMRAYYRGGAVSIEVADPYEGTDALLLTRPPFQGQGQIRLLEVAGAILPLNPSSSRANELVVAVPLEEMEAVFTLDDLISAPIGRADAFGVGIEPSTDEEEEDVAEADIDSEGLLEQSVSGPPLLLPSTL